MTLIPSKDLTHAERLLACGMKLVRLKNHSKQPEGLGWNQPENYVTSIDAQATGYGVLLKANGLCSVDPDNAELAAIGLKALGFDLEQIMAAGVRTVSTRPKSGGRSAFADPTGLKWVKFSSRDTGTVLELRAESENLQDVVAGLVYLDKDGSLHTQSYANGKTHADARNVFMPTDFEAFWRRCSSDVEFLRRQQTIFFEAIGCEPHLAVSAGDVNGKTTLAFKSTYRLDFNRNNCVVDILERHGYSGSGDGRYAPPSASGAPGVRSIPGKDDLWRSDHASDPLHGTFDAWSAFVQLDHKGNLAAAEAAVAAGDFEVVVADERHFVLPDFARNKKSGKILVNRTNLLLALKCPDSCGMVLAFDQFTGEVVVDAGGLGVFRPFMDADYTELALTLESGECGFSSIPVQALRELVHYTARGKLIDSAQMWLSSRPPWDGVERIKHALIRYFGAVDTPYTRAIGEYLFTALAGRVIEPGIKADMVVTVVGAQGLKKSSTVAAIAPTPDAFMELDLSEKDADLSRKMRGKVVIEFGELVGMRRKEKEALKAFITRTQERWIPKYMEHETNYARRSIFIATTNTDRFLDDDTGNRRWLPFTAGQCDPDAMARDRDQLWAEGAALFRRSGIAWQGAQQLAQAIHDNFVQSDVWSDDVYAYLHAPFEEFDGSRKPAPIDRGVVTVSEIMEQCLRIPIAQRVSSASKRVEQILRQLDWEPNGKLARLDTCDGSRKRARTWTPRLRK